MIYSKKPKDFIPDMIVVGCLVEVSNKILLLHRHNNKSQGSKWGIPAGKIDKIDKNKRQAMTRELYEETGLKINENDLNFYKTFYVVYPDKKYLYHYFNIKLNKNFEIKIKEDEHQNFIWVTLKEAFNKALVMHEDYCLKDYYNIS